MMESQATWGEAEHVIYDALKKADKAALIGVIGLSKPRRIADALRDAGLLKDTPESHPEWDACRRQ